MMSRHSTRSNTCMDCWSQLHCRSRKTGGSAEDRKRTNRVEVYRKVTAVRIGADFLEINRTFFLVIIVYSCQHSTP